MQAMKYSKHRYYYYAAETDKERALTKAYKAKKKYNTRFQITKKGCYYEIWLAKRL